MCHCKNPVGLPHCFCGCESLTRLGYGKSITLPKSLGLLSLKIYVASYRFSKDDAKIFSSCLNLKTLKLKSLYSFSLSEKLEFSKFSANPTTIQYGCKVMIFAPRLSSFKFDGSTPLPCSVDNLTYLDEMNVDLHPFFLGFPWLSGINEIKQEVSLYLIKMLNEFHDAKSITLSLATIEVSITRFTI